MIRSTWVKLFCIVLFAQVVNAAEAEVRYEQTARQLWQHLESGEYHQVEAYLSDSAIKHVRTRNGFLEAGSIIRYWAYDSETEEGIKVERLRVFDEWINHAPDSSLAHTARGAFYTFYAWESRGSDFASKVKEENWDSFKERLKLAKQDLEKAITLDPQNAVAHLRMMWVYIGLGSDQDKLDAVNAWYEQASNELNARHQETFDAQRTDWQEIMVGVKPEDYGLSEQDMNAFGQEVMAAMAQEQQDAFAMFEGLEEMTPELQNQFTEKMQAIQERANQISRQIAQKYPGMPEYVEASISHANKVMVFVEAIETLRQERDKALTVLKEASPLEKEQIEEIFKQKTNALAQQNGEWGTRLLTVALQADEGSERYDAYTQELNVLQAEYENRIQAARNESFEHMDAAFKRAIEQDPDFYEAYYAKLCYLMPKWHGDAESMLTFAREQAAQASTRSAVPLLLPLAHREIARSAKEAEEAYCLQPEVWEEIEQPAVRAMQAYPGSANIPMKLAEVAKACGKNDIAEQYLLKAIEADPKHAEARYDYARLLRFQIKDLDRALKAFSDAIEIHPKYGNAYYHRARIYIKQGEYALSEQDLKKAIALIPQDHDVHYEMGRLKELLTDFQGAVDAYTQAIDLSINEDNYYARRAASRVKLNQIEEAIKDYSRAAEIDPTNTQYPYNRGYLYIQQGKYTEAIEDNTQVLGKDPNHVGALKNRAHAYGKLGMADKRNEDRERWVELEKLNKAGMGSGSGGSQESSSRLE